MENKLFKTLTETINLLTLDNKSFISFFKETKFYKNMIYYVNALDLDVDENSMYYNFKNNYYDFIEKVLINLTSFNDNLNLSECNEIDNLLLKFYDLNKEILNKILIEKIPLEFLISFVINECNNLSILYKNKIHENIENENFNEIMKEKNKVNEIYSFLNYYNNFNLKNPSFKQDKVFSNKKLVRKIYHHNEKEIKFFFNKSNKKLEFFIVENYDISDLNYDIHENIDIHSIIEEFQKSL